MSCFPLLCNYDWKLSVMPALFCFRNLWKKKSGTVNSEWAGSALVKYLLHAGMRELGGFNLICYSIGTGVIQDHWQAIYTGIVKIRQLVEMAAFKCSVLHCPPCNAGLCAEKVIAETRSTVIDMITSKDDSMQFLVTIAYIAVVNQYSSHHVLLLPVNTSDLSSPFVYKLLVCWFLSFCIWQIWKERTV